MTLPVILPDRPLTKPARRLLQRLGDADFDSVIVLPEWLYDAAEAQGLNLTGYVLQQRLPVYESTIVERKSDDSPSD